MRRAVPAVGMADPCAARNVIVAPVARFVSNQAGDLAAQDRVLVTQHQQLGVFGGVSAQQDLRPRRLRKSSPQLKRRIGIR
jgi:hypothetical protein